MRRHSTPADRDLFAYAIAARATYARRPHDDRPAIRTQTVAGLLKRSHPMTCKDYEKIAAAMNRSLTDAILSGERTARGTRVTPTDEHVQGRLSGWALAMSNLADMLGDQSGYDANGNRRFDRDRFYHAAGWADYMRTAR